MLEDKVGTAMVEVGKDVAQDLVRPTSKSIGDNLGLLVDGVMGWLGYWGKKQAIKREVYLEDYKRKMYDKIDAIPDDKLQEPEIRIIGPVVEASKFHIEKDEFREMFAELVASACHADYAKNVHLAFPEMIKQLSYFDVKLLEMFKQAHTFPCCEIFEKHNDGIISPFPNILFHFKECVHSFSQSDELCLTESIENLERLGLLIKNSEVIELGYDYDQFKNHWLYSLMKTIASADSEIKMRKYRIELTQLGTNFVSCCFDK